MDFILLAKSTGILRPFAWLLSFIINGIYFVVSSLTQPQSMGITIILMTFAIRALMTPLTIKQQKSSRQMQRLQPQQKKIQDKYKGKTDPDAQNKMNAEIQKLYADNKTSPFSGCLPLLIQMPILFALYEILRNIPFYVNKVGVIYDQMVSIFQGVDGYVDIINRTEFAKAIAGIRKFDATPLDGAKDFLYHLSSDMWTQFFEITSLDQNTAFMEAYEAQKSINTFGAGIFTYNLTETPVFSSFDARWLIPILAGGLTLLQTVITDQKNKKRSKMIDPNWEEDPNQKSTKMLMWISPIMILVFGFQVPIGLGLYWIASSLFGIISQEIVDAILDKQELKEALAKREAYLAKQEENKALYGKSANFNSAWDAAQKNNTKSSMAGNKKITVAPEDNNEND